MKNFILTAVTFLMICATAFAENHQTSYSKIANNHQITFTLGDWNLETLTSNGTTFQVIDAGISAVSNKKGWAELPMLSAAIQLPADKNVSLEVISSDYYEMRLEFPALPSRGTIYRNQNPSEIPYWIDPASNVNEFYPSENVILDEPFIFRNVRGATVRFYPFQYNAATQTLRVYNSITIGLAENDEPAINPLTNNTGVDSREVIGIYKSLFLNYEPSRTSANLTAGEFGDILVLTPSTYESTMQPYVQWKREMGYNVTVQTVSSGANVVSTISSAYSSNPNLLYVQLVGDWADIKSATLGSSTCSSCPTDPRMGCVAGNDNYPDIAIGRFSCSSTSDLSVQINKAINYEKNPDMTSGWRETFIGVASEEGAGDDNEYDYTQVSRIYTTKLSQLGTYTSHKQHYANSGTVSASSVATSVNAGASTIAYCGHGAETYWVTSNYSTSNINSATNGSKLPFIVSVACVNGAFHESADCFAEGWLRKSNGGAVVTLMSTINQPWTPPMRGQDYFYDILTGGYNYDNDGISATNGINTTEQRTHWGSIVINAFTLMLKESNTTDDIETTKTWTTFGDASLQLRTKTPDVITSSNNEMIMGVPYTTTITIGNTPVANALVCISQNGNYYRGFTNVSGQVTITNNFSVGEALLVVTAFNTTTIYQTIPVNSANEPYVSIQSYSPQNVSFGTTHDLSMTLINMGGVATNGATNVSLTTTDQYLTLNTANATFGTMAAQGGTASSSAFNFSVAENTPDGHVATINATITNGSYTWNGTMNITIAGPACDAPTGLDVAVNGSSATISWDTQVITPVTISDDFEGHTAFTINSPGTVGWTYIDGDGSTTGAISNYNSWTNARSEMAYIVFNPSQVTSQYGSGNLSSSIAAHSGSQFLASFYASTPPNNDWIVSPELNFAENFTFSFYYRGGHKTTYTESFEVYYSTTTNEQSAFTNQLGTGTATGSTSASAWSQKTYTVPAAAKYVAIRCTSNDQYYFCIDDITISGTEISGAGAVNLYDNGVLVASNITTGTYTANNLTAGQHCFSIRAVCGDNSESMAAQECVNVTSSAPSYTVTVNAGNGGTITPSGTQTVYQNNDFTFTVTPDDCYEIANVTVDGNNVNLNANNSYTINNITANHTVNATFHLLSYTIAASAGDNGSISPAGNTNVNCGDNATFTITPDEGYEIADVTVDGQNIGSPSTYTFSNVEANHTINATFSMIPAETCYTITGLAVAVETYGNVLNWNAAENAVSYNIFRNNDNTVLANVNSTSYIDLNGNVGDSYRIVTVCQHGESESSESVTATTSSIDENSISLNIYPNPTDGKFTIECSEMITIEVFDMVGQLVEKIDVNANSTSIDASSWTNGVYTIRIATSDANIIVKQLIKQ
ncbi:MAG: choice-of-anchor J domain-containing protein [Bacteroidales bacterium]|nr:choice-of-anchor J domain-containing protein [Bacteroidales bacterium]